MITHVNELVNKDMVIFSGETAQRSGKLFEVGDYPDKKFSLTIEEADTAIANFTPFSLGVEHIPTVFDGMLGDVTKVWRSGKAIMGSFSLSKEIHQIFKGKPIPISTEWDRNKNLIGCDMVVDPRVQDAMISACFSYEFRNYSEEQRDEYAKSGVALPDGSYPIPDVSALKDAIQAYGRAKDKGKAKAHIIKRAKALKATKELPEDWNMSNTVPTWDDLVAFAKERHDTPQGQQVHQRIHDLAAMHGAVCNPDTQMSSKHEMKGLQAIHDEAVAHGAECNQPGGYYYSNDERKPNKMNLLEKVKAFFKQEGIDLDEEVKDPSGVVHTLGQVKVEETAEFKAEKERADKLAEELKAFKESQEVQFKRDNEAVIDQLVKDGKITFAKREENITRRAKNPELYDEMVKDMPVIAEFKTVDSNDPSLDVDPSKNPVTVETNIAAMSKSDWL